MLSIARRYCLALSLVILTTASAHAELLPRILQEPLLGLQYDQTKVKFEPLQKALSTSCQPLNDSETMHGTWFVFARASDASGRTYYLLNGYEIRNKPAPPHFPKYETGGSGFILGVNGDVCEVLEADARQLFKDRIFDDEFPFDMMQKLALDFATRLVKAYGSTDRLQKELVKQRIDLNKQPEEIRHALKQLL
jgi:hypothetical protein